MDVELHILPLAKPSKFVTKGKKLINKTWIYCGETPPSSPLTSTSSVSPLNELLEDLSSQAVADLHDVWLQKGRHTNSRSDSGFFQWLWFFFFWQMNAQTSVDDITLSLTLLKHLLPSFCLLFEVKSLHRNICLLYAHFTCTSRQVSWRDASLFRPNRKCVQHRAFGKYWQVDEIS